MHRYGMPPLAVSHGAQSFPRKSEVMPKPLAHRTGNRTSLTPRPRPALRAGNCGGLVPSPSSSHPAALAFGPADSIGGRTPSSADAPVSVRVMDALKNLPPEGCLE